MRAILHGKLRRMIMSINNIKCLSSNPHFSALLIQGFLSGYSRECDLGISFLVLPILFYLESREKLKTANKFSRLDTLFGTKQSVDNIQVSGKTRLAGFFTRYNLLESQSKNSVIILASEKKINLKKGKLFLVEKIDYTKYSGCVKDWLRCAHYLGVILSQYTNKEILEFLGAE